jgi:SAM-dependent methyltransferase
MICNENKSNNKNEEEGREEGDRQGDDGEEEESDASLAAQKSGTLTCRNVVCDVGCGDGRVILWWGQYLTEKVKEEVTKRTRSPGTSDHPDPQFPTLVGFDVDPDRIRTARDELQSLRHQNRISESVSIEFLCGNALDLLPSLVDRVAVCFLYLVPRGLRRIKPILLKSTTSSSSSSSSSFSSSTFSSSMLRVITYMSPLEGETPVRVERISVPHQPGSSWPLYLYEFSPGRQKSPGNPSSLIATTAATNEGNQTP